VNWREREQCLYVRLWASGWKDVSRAHCHRRVHGRAFQSLFRTRRMVPSYSDVLPGPPGMWSHGGETKLRKHSSHDCGRGGFLSERIASAGYSHSPRHSRLALHFSVLSATRFRNGLPFPSPCTPEAGRRGFCPQGASPLPDGHTDLGLPDVAGARAEVLPSRSMPTEQIVALLLAERDKLNRAIEALAGPAKRRGRPPKNPLAAAPVKRRKRRSAAQRKAQAEKMRAYWAKRRKKG
jgi:hypothetical protein